MTNSFSLRYFHNENMYLCKKCAKQFHDFFYFFPPQLPEHLGSVRTICQGKGSQFVVGSTRNSILQGTFELNFQEIVTGHVDEVWALSTHPSQNQFLTAGYDNLLHLWDTLTHRAVWSSNIGVSCWTIFILYTIGRNPF